MPKMDKTPAEVLEMARENYRDHHRNLANDMLFDVVKLIAGGFFAMFLSATPEGPGPGPNFPLYLMIMFFGILISSRVRKVRQQSAEDTLIIATLLAKLISDQKKGQETGSGG